MGSTLLLIERGYNYHVYLRVITWLNQWPSTARLHQPKFKTLARGQASCGGLHKASLGAASPGRLARRRRDQGEGTSRGAHGASHDDEDQAGARQAPACAVSSFPLWCKGGKRRRGVPRHQAKVSISMQQDQDQKEGKMEVIMEPKTASSPVPLAVEDHL